MDKGEKMENNVGKTDMIIRIVIGVILIIIGYTNNIWIFYIFAAIALLTGSFKVCPLYKIFNMNTAKKKT
jgi:hypothetical protein